MLKHRPTSTHPDDYVVILVVAILYAGTAYLGLILAVPPGYATAIWIPSGIALGAALVWGLRVLPGIFIGSFLTNYSVSINVGENLPLFLPFISGLLIATGAVLQTAFGFYLVNKFIGINNPLNDPRKIVLFGVLTGPVASLVNTTWSNLSLLVFNLLPVENFLLSWATWWIGDSIGVLIFTPMFLIFFSEPRILWRSRINTILLPLGVCFLAVLMMYLLVYRAELTHIQTSFNQLVTNSVLKIENEMNQDPNKRVVDVVKKNFADRENYYSIRLDHLNRPGNPATEYLYISDQSKPKVDQFFELMLGLNVNNQKYHLVVSPSNIYINTQITGVLWSVLVSGLFFCVLINTVLFIINGQKTLEEDLRFQKILEATPEVILLYNDKGEVIFANKESERVFAYKKSELLGTDINRLVPNLMLEKSPSELFGHKKNGSQFPIEKTSNLIQTKEGAVTLVVIRDVTERVKLEKLKNDFISVVSHELRTPLTSIQGALSFLTAGMSEYELNQKSSRLLLIAKQNSERLIRLINDILDIDKIESGRDIMHFKPIEVVKLIDDAIKINEPYAKNHNVTLEFPNYSEKLMVNGDYDRLIQVLTNLISNAIKFSPPAGSVSVSYIKVSSCVRISVTDLGQGIPEEFKEKIFQKFAQADATSVRKYGGSGLGLSISKSIIEKHQGIINYTVDRKGTTFYFEIPLIPNVEIITAE